MDPLNKWLSTGTNWSGQDLRTLLEEEFEQVFTLAPLVTTWAIFENPAHGEAARTWFIVPSVV